MNYSGQNDGPVEMFPATHWHGMTAGGVSEWARQASPEDAERTHTVVVFGHRMSGVHTRWIGIDCKPPGAVISKPKMGLWLLRYIIDGTATLTYAHNSTASYEVGPGMVVWSTPDSHTVETVTSDRPLRAFTILMFGEDIPERFSQVFASAIGSRRINEPGLIESLCAELFLEAQHRNIHRDSNCEYLTTVLLNRIATHLELSNSFAGEARLYFQQAQVFIDAHYATIQTTVEIADHCGLTRQYLGRVFKAFSGVSPHQYLSNLRMYHARESLITTDKPINQIASEVGYDDAGLFTRNFRKLEKESPRQFRARFRGGTAKGT